MPWNMEFLEVCPENVVEVLDVTSIIVLLF